jgi:hypothetical protein
VGTRRGALGKSSRTVRETFEIWLEAFIVLGSTIRSLTKLSNPRDGISGRFDSSALTRPQ